MRKVLLNVAVSLDGYIEGPKGEIDWCMTDQDYGMSTFVKRLDAIFIGRKSYDLLLTMDPNPYPDLTKYVFSRKLRKAAGKTIIVNGNVQREVRRIKKKNGKDIWLFGGADLVTQFVNANLIDEMHLSVHPLFLGSGTPLFQDIKRRKEFTLKEMKTYSTGLVQLLYTLRRR